MVHKVREATLRPDSVRLIGQMLLSRMTHVQSVKEFAALRVPVLAFLQSCELGSAASAQADEVFGALREEGENLCHLLSRLMVLVSHVASLAVQDSAFTARMARKP